MEVKPPGDDTDRSTASPDSAKRASPRFEEKYKGSREAARRSKAGYSGILGKPPLYSKDESGRKGIPGWVKLVGVLAAVILIGVVILVQTGVFDLSSPARVAQKERPEPKHEPKPEPKPAADEKAVLPEAQPETPAPPPATAGTDRPEEKAENPVRKLPADHLQNLAALKEKLMSGSYPDQVLRSFDQGCLDQLASAVDYYNQDLVRQGNDALSGLDDILTPEFVKKMDFGKGLAIEVVSAEIIRSVRGEKSLRIEGRIKNGSPNTWDRILLLSILNDKDGAVVAKSFTLAGRIIPEADYFKPHQVRARTLLDTQPGAETVLGPGGAVPFLFVFSNLPQSAKQFTVTVVLTPEGPPE